MSAVLPVGLGSNLQNTVATAISSGAVKVAGAVQAAWAGLVAMGEYIAIQAPLLKPITPYVPHLVVGLGAVIVAKFLYSCCQRKATADMSASTGSV